MNVDFHLYVLNQLSEGAVNPMNDYSNEVAIKEVNS